LNSFVAEDIIAINPARWKYYDDLDEAQVRLKLRKVERQRRLRQSLRLGYLP
jgi:citrate lyase alpha subunit